MNPEMETDRQPPEFMDNGNAGINKLQQQILGPPNDRINRLGANKAERNPLNIEQIKAHAGGQVRGAQDQAALDRAYRQQAPLYNNLQPIETKKTVTDLLKDFGAPKYDDRQRALSILESKGPAVLPQLRAQRENADIEISGRAKSMIHRIEMRSVLAPGKSIIEVDEKLHPRKGEDLPDNWSQLSDELIKQAGKIDKKIVSALAAEITTSPQEKAQSLEQMDIQRLNEIVNYPRVTCAKILSEHKGGSKEQQTQRMNKSIDLLADALEKREVEPNNRLLLELAASTNAIENPRFLSAFRQALAASEVRWRTKGDREIKDQFEKLKKEHVMEPPQAQ